MFDTVDEPGTIRHRATYILERGMWHATCRVCGWQSSDRERRRAASKFRVHIRSESPRPGPQSRQSLP